MRRGLVFTGLQATRGCAARPRRYCTCSRELEDQHVPLIDISSYLGPRHQANAAERDGVAVQWDAAMADIGFAIITGHGVSPDCVGTVRSAAHEFFELGPEEKQAYHHGPYGNPRGGYTAIGSEAVSRSR